jgi:hypothetical protein
MRKEMKALKLKARCLLDSKGTAMRELKANFLIPLNKWLSKYMPGAAQVTL